MDDAEATLHYAPYQPLVANYISAVPALSEKAVHVSRVAPASLPYALTLRMHFGAAAHSRFGTWRTARGTAAFCQNLAIERTKTEPRSTGRIF
jgi:hypothetical protein